MTGGLIYPRPLLGEYGGVEGGSVAEIVFVGTSVD
jgi:hypothetical protein